MKKKPIIAANWKMYVGSAEEGRALILETRRVTEKAKRVSTIVCPSFSFIAQAVSLCKKRKRLFVGAQNCFYEDAGAFTGEVGARELASIGATHVIIGHSERRSFGETNEIINKKVKAAIRAGLFVILCVGEKERDVDGHYLSFLRSEITAALSGVPGVDMRHIILAYEPVWAIGRGEKESMKPKELHETAIFARKVIAKEYGTDIAFDLPILYGGSIGPHNVKDHLEAGVEGLLVGHASAEKASIRAIIEAADAA